ncbi:MAG: CRISPR-associated endonuclease Cas2 [Rhodocyclaceae bacterium]|nr:CRISPR-associated endonuclease Cas2 [Rhodocyclaceae bacterium]
MSDYVICYDITHPKRLGRIHRYLKKHAMPLQYSVFLFSGDERRLARLLDTLAALIDEKEDDLRCYPLPSRGHRERLGRAVLPRGIQWSGLPPPLA